MKKIFFPLLAIGAIASCAKTEVASIPSEIKITPATSLATKANYNGVMDSNQYEFAENFDVYGYWSADWNENGAVVDYLLTENGSGAEFAWTKEGNTWKGVIPYHWPKDGSLKFAAYSPASEDFAHDYATDTYSKTSYVHPSETDKTWDLLFAKTTADYTAMTSASGVPIVFEHALSWITIKVVAVDETAAQAFDIKKVTINDVYTQADAAIDMADGIQTDDWSNLDVKAPYEVFAGDQQVTTTTAVIENTDDDGKALNGTIVIPQSATTLTINYNQNELAGTAALEDQTIVLDLALEDAQVWAPGKHYTYTIVFGLDEILITPSVVNWDSVQVENDEAVSDRGNIKNGAKFLEAIAAGVDNIVLGKDITLTQPCVISHDVVIDLNGKDISADDIEKLFTVADGAKVTVIGNGIIRNVTHGAGTENAPVVAVFFVEDGELELKEGASVEATDDNGGYIDAILVAEGAKLAGNDSRVKAVSKTGIAVAVRGKGLVDLTECEIEAYADHTANAAGTAIATTARGLVIEETGELLMKDCYAFGSFNGGLINGKATINGGRYEGYGAGGFYITASDQSVLIKDAELRAGVLPEGFIDDGVAGTNGAGLYIGVGKNIKVFVDNCVIYGPTQPIVMRDGSGALGNKLYISNSVINLDYTHRGIRNDGTSYVYFGVDNNFNEDQLQYKRNFAYTDETYDSIK